MELKTLAALRNLVDSIRFDDTSLTASTNSLRQQTAQWNRRQSHELAQLLGLDPNVPRERILTALIQASGQHTGLAPVKHYQNLLNRWFQTLGQADAALPFLRCVEFYASQLSPAAAQSYFSRPYYATYWRNARSISKSYWSKHVNAILKSRPSKESRPKPLFSGSNTQDLDTTFAYDVDHEFPRPKCSRRLPPSSCAIAAYSPSLPTCQRRTTKLLGSKYLRGYDGPLCAHGSKHFLGEAVLQLLVPSSSDSPLSSGKQTNLPTLAPASAT